MKISTNVKIATQAKLPLKGILIINKSTDYFPLNYPRFTSQITILPTAFIYYFSTVIMKMKTQSPKHHYY